MNISLKQFEYFLAVADTGQVSKAALRCHISQSSMTVALRNLEQAIGVRLFVRHVKGLSLTDAGVRFMRHARNVVNAAQEAVADVGTMPSGLRGTVRIGVTETISAYLIPAVIATAAERFPNLRIEVVEHDRDTIEAGLLQCQFDLALLIVSNLRRIDALEYAAILESQRHLWVAPTHPLSRRQRPDLAGIARHGYVLLDMDEHVDTVGKYWAPYKLYPEVRFRSRSPEAVRSLVALGQGITILSDLVYRPWSLEGRRILRLELADPVPSMDVGVAWRRRDGLTATGDALVRFLDVSIKSIAQANA